MSEFWCKCGNPSERVTYHADTPDAKHHWTCDDCGKVRQVG
jgi:Fe2+ or Zn2+ uptake regulation protein